MRRPLLLYLGAVERKGIGGVEEDDESREKAALTGDDKGDSDSLRLRPSSRTAG